MGRLGNICRVGAVVVRYIFYVMILEGRQKIHQSILLDFESFHEISFLEKKIVSFSKWKCGFLHKHFEWEE